MRKILVLSMIALLWVSSVQAADIPVDFDSPSDQLRYNKLLEELRCLVCQNQSLADSHAELAQDLRTEVYNMIVSGQGNADIVKFMVERYGDFVLYKPPMNTTTWLLWFGPALLVITALMIVVVAARKNKAQRAPLSDADRDNIRRLINTNDNGDA
jgi:cytochrome c-type biogenesis protein CcmH